MCGIAGFVGRQGVNAEVLQRMTDALVHRGPDGSGRFIRRCENGTGLVGLGHRRLAIIDLAGGAQPMADAEGQLVLTFNGEIYNYRELRAALARLGHTFQTHSDTEVILAAYREWDVSCVERFNGMFAFALWDARRERLFLARDRFGKKPLFLIRHNGGLAFASEIKALLGLPWMSRQLDPIALAGYFAYRYVPGPQTFFSGVRKLPPAHYALFEKGIYCEARYYVIPDSMERGLLAAGRADRKPENAVDEFLRLLNDAVKARMVSDVPFGAFLSGGIDSSAVVALMARHGSRPITTFSVGFDEAAYSELEYAGEVARHLGTEHHEIVVRHGDVADLLPELTWFRDAPVAEPADAPLYRMSRAAAGHVKMILSGEGSDEVLGGYPKHVYEPWVTRYQDIVPPIIHRLLVEPLAQFLPYNARRIRTLVESAGLYDHEIRMARWFGALTPTERKALLALQLPHSGADIPLPLHEPLRSILAFDQQSWLPDNLLERGDRMTMAASIEARMPFMDHRIAEYVSGLPDRLRVNGRTTKWLLRRAMEQVLPGRILTRPKVGFRVPVAQWFREQWRDMVHDALIDTATSSTEGIYDRLELRRIVTEHQKGYRNHEKLLWSLLALELFQRRYRLAI
jgi:asparagine synthase (glutamine-hydrolysing)